MRARSAFLGGTAGLLLSFPLLAMGGAAAKVTLDYFAWDGGDAVKQIEEYWIKPFEAQHPDIAINYSYTSFSEFWNKLPTLIAAGEAPDLIHMSVAYVYDYAKAGLLQNLQPWFNRDLDPDDYFMQPAAAVRYPSITSGDLYAIPFGFVETVLYYNRDLFDPAGVPYPSEDWNWQGTVLEAARKLTADTNGDGIADRWGFDSNYGYSLIDSIIHAWGGATLSDDYQRVLLDQPPAAAGVQYLVDTIWKQRVAPPLNLRDQFSFKSGKMGMYVETTFPITELRSGAKFDWNVAMMPSGPRQRIVRLWPDSFAVPKGSKQSAAAWEFIKFAITHPNPYADMRRIPFSKKLALSPAWLRPGETPDMRVFIDSVQYSRPLEFRPKWGEWRPLRDASFKEAFENKIPVTTALAQATQKIRAVLAAGQ